MESWRADEQQMGWSKVRRKKMQQRESQKKEDSHAPNVREVATCCVFSMVRGSWCSKSRLVKAAMRSQVVREEKKNCTPLWRETHFQVKPLRNWRCRSTFWRSDVEKLHAAVARNAFSSENVEKNDGVGALFEGPMSKNCTPLLREMHFLVKMLKKWRCRSTFWRAVVQVKMRKNQTVPVFEVPMSKNGTPMWREAHLQVKMHKTPHSRTAFWSSDVEKLHAAVARSTFARQNVQKTCVLGQFLKFRCREMSQSAS